MPDSDGQVMEMNPFLLALALYTVLITPLSLRVRARLGEPFRYELSLFVFGVKWTLGCVPSKKSGQRAEERQTSADQKKDDTFGAAKQVAMVVRLLTYSHPLRAVLRFALQLQCVRLNVRMALPNAAANALAYALLDTLFSTLRRCGVLPACVHIRLHCDWQQHTQSVETMGILFSRLGILLGAGVIWLAALIARRAQKAGGQHAASH